MQRGTHITANHLFDKLISLYKEKIKLLETEIKELKTPESKERQFENLAIKGNFLAMII